MEFEQVGNLSRKLPAFVNRSQGPHVPNILQGICKLLQPCARSRTLLFHKLTITVLPSAPPWTNPMKFSFYGLQNISYGLHFLKVKMGLFVDNESQGTISPDCPSPLPDFLPPCLGHRTPCQLTGAVRPWPRGTSAALQLHTALPACLPRLQPKAQGWGCTGVPQLPTAAWGWDEPWHQSLPWPPLCPNSHPMCSSLQGVFNESCCLSFFLKYYVA